jgi:hypothetical protein
MRRLRSVVIGLLDTDGDRHVNQATVSYSIYDDADATYSSRGSFTLVMSLCSLQDFMSDVVDQICLEEGLSSCPSSSSSPCPP